MKSSRRILNISLIGAGSVGTTLVNLLHRSGARIVSVVSRTRKSALKCGKTVSCRLCSDDIAIIPQSTNLIIIAVPDQSIQVIAASLASLERVDFRRTAICHTSGALTSGVLEPLAQKGAKIFSFHPAQTFPPDKPLKEQLKSMTGITYGIEGPVRALGFAKSLARRMGGEYLVVPKEEKILYHCACVIASNYSVTLIGAMEELVGRFSAKKLGPFKKLMETSIGNAMVLGASKSLTGPIVRGSAETVSDHLKALDDSDLRTLYKALGAYTLKIAEKNSRVSREAAQSLRELLKTSG